MGADYKMTAEIVTQIADDTLNKFEDLLKGVLKNMKAIDKEASTFLKGIPQGNSVAKILNKVNNATAKNIKLNNQNTKAQTKYEKASRKVSSANGKNAVSMGGINARLAQIRVRLGLVSFAAKGMLAAFVIPAGFLAGWSFFLKVIGDGERKMQNMAKAVNVSTNFFRAMGLVADDAGLSIENASDLIEELPNRIGDAIDDLAGTGKSAKGFASLGLSAVQLRKDLVNLGREETFVNLIDSIANSNMTLDAKIRTGDEIFGGEGNRMLAGILDTMERTGKSFNEVIRDYKKLASINEAASKAAAKFSLAFRNLNTSIKNVIVEGLKPMFEELTPLVDKFTEFISTSGDVDAFAAQLITVLGNAFFFVADILLSFVEVLVLNKSILLSSGAVAVTFAKAVFDLGIAFLKVTSYVSDSNKALVVISTTVGLLSWKFSGAITTIAKSVAWLTLLAKGLALNLLWTSQAFLAMLWPLLPLIGLLTAFGFAIKHLWDNSAMAAEGMKAIWESFVTVFKVLITPIIAIFEVFSAVIKTVWDVFATGGKNIEQIWGKAFGNIGRHLDGITGKIKEATSTFQHLLGLKDINDPMAADNSPEVIAAKLRIKTRLAATKARQDISSGGSSSSTSNINNSTSTTSGDTHVTINTSADPQEVVDVINRNF